MVKLVLRGLFIFVVFSHLAGCFYLKTPILTHMNGEPLPGGAGKFSEVSRNKEDRRIITVQEGSNSHPYEYTMVWNEDGQLTQTPAIFDHIKDDIYVMQIKENDKFVVLIASIDENGISFFDIDEDVINQLLIDQDFAIVQIPLFGDKEPANQQITTYHSTDKDFAVKGIGIELYGKTEKILHFVRKLATLVTDDQKEAGLIRID